MKNRTRVGIVAATAAGLAITLGLSGCSFLGIGGNDKLTVGVLPSVESAPLYLGLEQGFFEEEGITLSIASFATGASAMVKPVVEGKYDVAVSDLLTLMAANDSGQPVKLIAPAGSASGDIESDFGALIVNGDSPIQSLTDLEGKSVGSNSLLDTNNTVLRSTMEEGDAQSGTLQWKEVPFQDASTALSNGTVDATFLVEPYLTKALNDGKRVISFSYSEFNPKLDVNAYFTSAGFAEKSPELLERFTKALTRSIEFAQKNPIKIRTITSNYTEAQWNVRSAIVLPTYTAKFDKDAAAKLATAAVTFAGLKAEPDMSSFLP